ncbi:MAG: hydrogenase maturation nickel metallochaperone HypA [Gemmatimonadota bacterium]|nr:hydrogenase maturation nickel metallochaperone HypA [Gemmatimonadota bacterium]
MHELSIAMEICRITEEAVGPDRLGDVIEVGLDVGVDADVVIDNLEFCLEALLAGPPFGRGRPVIASRPGDDLRVTYLEVDDADQTN